MRVLMTGLRLHRVVGRQEAARLGGGGLDLRPEGGDAPARPAAGARGEGAGPLRARGLAEPESVRGAVERVGATHLLHLAGLQAPACRANPIAGAKVNVIGMLAVLEAAVALKEQVARVVYASSAAVHGPADPDAAGPLAEEVRLAPLTHYGAFKVCNELNARVYWLDHGIASVGLRPWTVYGVGRDFGMTSAPTKAIKAVAAGQPHRISHGGRQDLQYAGDVVATFLRALHARGRLDLADLG